MADIPAPAEVGPTATVMLASLSKLPSGVDFLVYVCEPSTDGAVMHFVERFGYPPARVYQYKNSNGRVTIFCEMRKEEKKDE